MNKLKFLLGFAVVTLLVCLGFKWPAKVETYNLANGKIVFQDKCTGCHGAKGEGSFGPNLTDNYYMHGHHLHNVIHIIKHGHKNGMTAFAHHLNHRQIHDVAHYVLSLKGTNPSGAKAPQGKLHK